MKVLGLISGGKDSCYNLIECVREGHEVVALGNLKPAQKDELDSFMYQTVGHDVIDLYAEAIGIPLFRKVIAGRAVNTDLQYLQIEDDEVEDLTLLLKSVQEEILFDAVAVGAILSDYQRIRVENVCSRLGIKCLAYLWQRDQEELLQDMIDSKIHAVLIKVATLVEKRPFYAKKRDRNVYISGLCCDKVQGEDVDISIRKAFLRLKDSLSQNGCRLDDCIRINLYLSNMDSFSIVNDVYKDFFKIHPPTRVCLEIPMHENCIFFLECQAIDCSENVKVEPPTIKTLHVQGISHWAPANIGPYSQAKKVGSLIFVSGSIGLDPGSMLIVSNDVFAQAQLALHHVDKVLQATDPSCSLKDATLVICYIVVPEHKSTIESIFKQHTENESESRTILQVIVVSRLPRDALVEWNVIAHKSHDRNAQESSFESRVKEARIETKAVRYTCDGGGFFSISVGRGKLDDLSLNELFRQIEEDVKRSLLQCGSDEGRLLGLQLYLCNLEANTLSKQFSDYIESAFKNTAISFIETAEKEDFKLVGYIL